MSEKLHRVRTTLYETWGKRSLAQKYVADKFQNAGSHLKADALEMATMQLQMPKKEIFRSLVAEFIATCFLVVLGCGSTLYLRGSTPPGLAGVALCWGFTVATLAQTFGHVSGCHMNPSVTLAMLITGNIQLINAILYVAVQSAGAIAGIALLKGLSPDNVQGNFGMTVLARGVTPVQGFGIEFVATFLLLLIVFGATDKNRTDLKGSAPLAIGLTVAALILYCGPMTGCSLNPARSLGPSVIVGNWDNHWVFWVGPIFGGITAATMYQQFFRALSPEEVAAVQAAKESDEKESGNPPV